MPRLHHRLAHLYGSEQRLEVGPGPDGGTVVTVGLPFREAVPEEAKGESRASNNGADRSHSGTNFRARDERCQLRSKH